MEAKDRFRGLQESRRNDSPSFEAFSPIKGAGGPDDGIDPIAVALCVVESLQDQGDGRVGSPLEARPPLVASDESGWSRWRARTARGSPARSTAPTIAASSSPRRSHSTAIASAWIPEVSSHETVKLGPPIRNSRAIRLATSPPRDPIVRLAVRAGPAASRSSSTQRARASLRQAEAQLPVPLPGPIGHRPSQVEVGGVQVQPDADEHARPEGEFRVPPGVPDRLGRDPEHQRLLGQHLAQFLGRDPELVDPELQGFETISRKGFVPWPARIAPSTSSLNTSLPCLDPTCAEIPTMAMGNSR